MTVDLTSLDQESRVLFKIPLQPIQGSRFQPTGFPALGAATFQTSEGTNLLVESAQSMANRLELTIWDSSRQDLTESLNGLSHIQVTRGETLLTDTILESHRINSPYILEGKDKRFLELLKQEVGVMETGPIDRRKLARALFKFDVNSLLHGVFLAKKDLAGGRLRVARALSAFVEAEGVQIAASGGVKNDHVNPSGDTASGFGNVPFARDEYTADSINLYVNLDLAQIRGYGLRESEQRLLVLLALYKLKVLTGKGLRLRTACDLEVIDQDIRAAKPNGWQLPDTAELEASLRISIDECRGNMEVHTVTFEDELKKGKSDD